jgi:hypothetical protein
VPQTSTSVRLLNVPMFDMWPTYRMRRASTSPKSWVSSCVVVPLVSLFVTTFVHTPLPLDTCRSNRLRRPLPLYTAIFT